MELRGWNVIDPDAAVLWREYTFSKGAYATTFVFRGNDGLVVVSPAPGLGQADYDALKEFGDVRALIASNTFHHLGQSAWRAQFKDAESYAPPRVVPILEKKAKGTSFRPLDELVLPEHVHWEDAPGFKSGETILSVGTHKGSVWYTSDVITNIQRTPGPPLKWLFSLTDSAPGFKLFRLGIWLFVKDTKALRAWMLARLAADPPAIVVPGHGPAVEAPDVAAQTRAQIERL